jgi:hypothetical protein
MMVRRACLVTLLVWAVAADSAFDCKPTVDGKQYDLSFVGRSLRSEFR